MKYSDRRVGSVCFWESLLRAVTLFLWMVSWGSHHTLECWVVFLVGMYVSHIICKVEERDWTAESMFSKVRVHVQFMCSMHCKDSRTRPSTRPQHCTMYTT